MAAAGIKEKLKECIKAYFSRPEVKARLMEYRREYYCLAKEMLEVGGSRQQGK